MERHAHFGKYISRVSCDINEKTQARATSCPTTGLLLPRVGSLAGRQLPLCVSFSHSFVSVRVSALSQRNWCLTDAPHLSGRYCGEAPL